MTKIEESLPHSIKDKIYKKVRRKKLDPPKTNLHIGVVPRKSANHVARMYRYDRAKEDEDMIEEEFLTEDIDIEVAKSYEDMKKSMAEVSKLFTQLNQAMQQSTISMQKWEKLYALQGQQEQREQRAKQRIERSTERIEPVAGAER